MGRSVESGRGAAAALCGGPRALCAFVQGIDVPWAPYSLNECSKHARKHARRTSVDRLVVLLGGSCRWLRHVLATGMDVRTPLFEAVRTERHVSPQ
jgi:hypothetical protein